MGKDKDGENMRRSMRVWITVLCITALVIGGIAYDSRHYSRTRFSVSCHTLTSEKIGASMDGMSIVCFGDLEFGTYMDITRFTMVVDAINSLSPDVVLFLGDLYDEGYVPDEDTRGQFVNLLSSIRAAYGKFAVLGDYDVQQEEMVRSDLSSAGYELIENKVLHLHYGGSDYITLVGLQDSLRGNPDIDALYAEVPTGSYTIAVSHTPDTARSIPLGTTDLFVCANAHGAQRGGALFGSYQPSSGSSSYSPGKHLYNGMTIYASRGVGTTKEDIRLFCDPEILLFRIRSS